MTHDGSNSSDFTVVSGFNFLWVNFVKYKCNITGRTRTEIKSKTLTLGVILFQVGLAIFIFLLNCLYKKALFEYSISKDGIPKAQEGVSRSTH